MKELRERIQLFEGVVIKRRGGGVSETFTVRKISYGVGVERAFPVHTPKIAKLEVIRHGKVRRAKLYYLRELRGKKHVLKKFVVNSSNIFMRVYHDPHKVNNQTVSKRELVFQAPFALQETINAHIR